MTQSNAARLVLVPEPVPEAPAKKRSKGSGGGKGKRRSTHPGVTHLKPTDDGRNPRHRARYRDPDTRSVRVVTMGGRPDHAWPTAHLAVNAELRLDFMAHMSKTIRDRRDAIRGGEERFTGGDTDLEELFASYFKAWGLLKRAASQKSYRYAVKRFRAWCELAGIRTAKQITKANLRTYKRYCVEQYAGTTSPVTINNWLGWLGAVLNELVSDGKLKLGPFDTREALAPLEEKTAKKGFYRSAVLRAILDACRKYDAAERNRSELAGRLLATVLFFLLTGLRPKEAFLLRWEHVISDEDGMRIHVPIEIAKVGERDIQCGHSPLLAHLLSQHAQRNPKARILSGSASSMDAARAELASEHGGPEVQCYGLRRTCGTFLACAPGIFGAASIHLAAAQLGHSVKIAQKHYVGAITTISRDAHTTEDAMQLGIKPGDCPTL